MTKEKASAGGRKASPPNKSSSTRKTAKPKAPPTPPSRWQRIAKTWAVVVAIGAVVGGFFLNINDVLTNVRALPGEVHKTTDQFTSWYSRDQAWTGYWSSSAEGYVDSADMNLSTEPVAVELEVKNGVIGGTIATRQICQGVPFYDFLLLKGNVSLTRDGAWVTAWDTFLGHDRDIARLRLRREGSVLTIEPKAGTVNLFPTKARVALDPAGRPDEPFCTGKQEAIAKQVGQLLKESRKAPASGSE